MATNMTDRVFVFVIGALGSGKGTICQRLASDFNEVYHLSIGDFLRDGLRRHIFDTPYLIRLFVQRGRLLPWPLLEPMLAKKMREVDDRRGPQVWLIDGFPRSLAQANEFEQQFGKPALVLYLGCPKHVAKDRFLTRDRSGRPTDSATIFERRYNEFLELNDPIVRYYESDQNMLAKIDSTNATEDTYAEVLAALRSNETWKSIINEPEEGMFPVEL